MLGILTNRDIRFAASADMQRPVAEFMTTRKLVTAPVGTTLDEAQRILQERRIEKLLLVDEHKHLKGLITVKDIQKKRDYPTPRPMRAGVSWSVRRSAWGRTSKRASRCSWTKAWT